MTPERLTELRELAARLENQVGNETITQGDLLWLIENSGANDAGSQKAAEFAREAPPTQEVTLERPYLCALVKHLPAGVKADETAEQAAPYSFEGDDEPAKQPAKQPGGSKPDKPDK